MQRDYFADRSMKAKTTMIAATEEAAEVKASYERPADEERPFLKEERRSLGRKIALKDQHEVKQGESLWWIAKYKDIYNDPYLWPLIHAANGDVIGNPHVIYPGQVLKIPRNGFDMEAITQHRKKAGAPRPWTPQRGANAPLH